MGNACAAPPEVDKTSKLDKNKTKQIDAALQKDRHVQSTVSKLLLLGAGESGKSTLFKQMISIYGKGFDLEARKGYIHVVHLNTVASAKVLTKQIEVSADDPAVQATGPVQLANDDTIKSKLFIDALNPTAPIDHEVAAHIARLWKDPAIQNLYVHRSKYQINDSAKYFLDQVEQVAKPDFIPTEQDVLRTRVRTTGLVETEFEIDEHIFKMFDVGGQRNERKKWIHCFEKVTAVIFVAAISEYDQMLYEDEKTNRMHEALNLFDEICNSKWFEETAMILFLNKRDLFVEKIKTVPLTVCFPDYAGSQDYAACSQFIQQEFESKNHKDKAIYTHVVSATDKDNIMHVFNDVKDIIINKSLEQAGLG